MLKSVRNYLFAVVGATLVLTASPAAYSQDPAWHPAGKRPAVADKAGKARVTAIGQILTHQRRYVGREVTVQGDFRGWQEPCPSSAMITRSDWVLNDGTGCIYVSGPIPPSLSPAHPRGEIVSVKGRIMRAKDGKPVIKADRVSPLPK